MAGFKRHMGPARSSGFNRNDRTSRPSSPGRPLFPAVCAKCGKACQIPFQPSSGKPVYCRDCFQKGEDRPAPGKFEPRQSARPPMFRENPDMSQTKKQLEEINKKLDKILSLLTYPLVAPEE